MGTRLMAGDMFYGDASDRTVISIESVVVVVESYGTTAVYNDLCHIKAGLERIPCSEQIFPCGTDAQPLLCRSDGIGSTLRVSHGSGLYLHKGDDVVLLGNKVYLSAPDAPVALKNAVARLRKIVFREPFAHGTGLLFSPHNNA